MSGWPPGRVPHSRRSMHEHSVLNPRNVTDPKQKRSPSAWRAFEICEALAGAIVASRVMGQPQRNDWIREFKDSVNALLVDVGS